MYWSSIVTENEYKFPSPLGVSYFQIVFCRTWFLHGWKRVSVPSRGILFPNSPPSDIIIHHCDTVSVPSRGILFPNRGLPHTELTRYSVSVPSRGILFPNIIDMFADCEEDFTVSVPSRGILFPNQYTSISIVPCESSFPSPLGVSYFQIGERVRMVRKDSGFRPLSGYLISKWKNVMKWFATLVSVPSRGILFPNISPSCLSSIGANMFPSPLGVSYFQMEIKNGYRRIQTGFPSPLGVSYFQISM